MAGSFEEDLGVDVLIVGGGIQGIYLARQLMNRYSVAILTDPDAPSETFDSPGYFSAGYEGTDVARIQPARRAAGYWKLWAESNGVPHDLAAAYAVVPPERDGITSRLWADATLVAKPAVALPQIFGRGSLIDQPAYLLENDVVMNPTDFMAKLREGLDDRIIWGTVAKWGLATDTAIDFVEVQVGEELLPITARYVVLASNVGNGTLLHGLVARFRDHANRREAGEKVRTCQAVRRRLTLVARGAELPLVAGHYGPLQITAHPYGELGEYVWVINAPVDDRQTVLGPEDVRFDPLLDRDQLHTTLDQLFDIAPQVEKLAPGLQWSVYTARKTEHPSMAVPDASAVPQPAPAKLETLEMEGFVAVWPSHLAYAMIVGDVIAERIGQALGPAGDYAGGLQPEDFPRPPAEAFLSRWERSGFPWATWAQFTDEHRYTR